MQTKKTKTKETQQNMLNKLMSHTTNKQKNKNIKSQQNMLNHLMSHTTNKQKQKQNSLNRTWQISLYHTQQANKENKNKRASTEHAQSAYVTHNKQK